MSVRLAEVCNTSKSKTIISGVCRQKVRGIPTCVEQLEENTKEHKAKMLGTLKTAILKNDALCKDFVACSIYDSNPFYLFSSSCPDIKRIKKDREVCHPGLENKIKVPFYRLNMIDNYNNNINNVDISDQLRTVYRYDRWICKQK